MEPRLMAYLYYFNIKRDYYECHEYGESLWLDTGRPVILKGLIQAAVCLYHLHNGNVKGGYSMWQRARRYMDGERPVYEHIDLDTLTADIDDVFARVPEEFMGKVLPANAIQRLDLPVVQIHITDEHIRQQLQTFTPEPLTEEQP